LFLFFFTGFHQEPKKVPDKIPTLLPKKNKKIKNNIKMVYKKQIEYITKKNQYLEEEKSIYKVEEENEYLKLSEKEKKHALFPVAMMTFTTKETPEIGKVLYIAGYGETLYYLIPNEDATRYKMLSINKYPLKIKGVMTKKVMVKKYVPSLFSKVDKYVCDDFVFEYRSDKDEDTLEKMVHLHQDFMFERYNDKEDDDVKEDDNIEKEKN
jgi:hypothetical protein